MKNRNTKKADAIFFGDVHLRDDVPICRTDDFMAAQWNKLTFIDLLQRKHKCPVFCSGDLFHKAMPSLYLVAKAILHLPENLFTVYGQHDLPNHNMKLKDKSGIYLLETAGALTVLDGTHWADKPSGPSFEIKGKSLLVWHTMTYQSKSPYGDAKVKRARSLLHQYPEYDVILTGDNHTPFIEKYKGRILVNPGSMMRQEAAQIEYQPAVYLWYADTNEVEKVPLPIDKGVITREHLELVNERDNRIHSFIETLDTKGLDFLNFQENLNVFMANNRIRKQVKELIYELTDDGRK